MQEKLKEILGSWRVPLEGVPPESISLVKDFEYRHLSPQIAKWSLREHNHEALCYRVETEHAEFNGVILRNLQSGKFKDQTLIKSDKGPACFSFFHCNLPAFWLTGVAVVVEGPKDALALTSNGIPATAYLGISPTKKHLRVLRRYVRSVIWISDNEFQSVEKKRAKEFVRKSASDLGLRISEWRCSEKDPAELVKRNPSALGELQYRYGERIKSVLGN